MSTEPKNAFSPGAGELATGIVNSDFHISEISLMVATSPSVTSASSTVAVFLNVTSKACAGKLVVRNVKMSNKRIIII